MLLSLLHACTNRNKMIDEPFTQIEGGKEYTLRFADSLTENYIFYSNKRLNYFEITKTNFNTSQIIGFYEAGGLEFIRSKNNIYIFYPSGNLKTMKYLINDSIQGYYVDYYDKYNCKRQNTLVP